MGLETTADNAKAFSYSTITSRSMQSLKEKKKLTEKDFKTIFGLPRTEREKILEARGWTEIKIPENINSYEELERVDTLPEGVRHWAIKNLREKEKDLPFEVMKNRERWLIPKDEYPDFIKAEDAIMKEYAKYGSRSNHNNCDFSKGQQGDILLVHDTEWWQPGAIYGYFCHSGMIINPNVSDSTIPLFAIAAYRDRGVSWDSKIHWHNYNYCMIIRVNTWPRSTSLRHDAAMYVEAQLGKPYQIPAPFNKWNTHRWYCSQLDWGGYWHRSPWYAKVDIDGIPDNRDFSTVSPDALFYSWRTYKVTGAW